MKLRWSKSSRLLQRVAFLAVIVFRKRKVVERNAKALSKYLKKLFSERAYQFLGVTDIEICKLVNLRPKSFVSFLVLLDNFNFMGSWTAKLLNY